MTAVDVLSVFNFGLLFLFGAILSLLITGGCQTRREWVIFFALCAFFLAVELHALLVFGADIASLLYPLYIHLPLLLGLTLGLKRPVGVSLVSICAAYLCCQLPRCGAVIIEAATDSSLAGQIVYTLIIAPIFFLLQRYFVPTVRDTMAESQKSLFLFGSVPILYYIYDYTLAGSFKLLYSELLSSNPDVSAGQVAAELLPTAVCLLYMVYTTAYRHQLRQRTEVEMHNSLLDGQLKQAEAEMASLRQAEAQAAAYQHDMRHHLAAINAFLDAGRPRQAESYIKQIQADIEAITPKRFCENELINLLCSSFSAKAERIGVRLRVEAAVSGSLAISDTELCALLSNGLENALNAVGKLKRERRWVDFYCGIRLGKLLIEIRNPYAGQISFRDGLPIAAEQNHGHGCCSIHTITQTHQGLCEFSAEGKIFTLRVALPV